ncbi:hypothetical protein [Massilia sp. LjRoot122]|uniref:hypothetical protein n=1 Tax=Massilia sp. LjRoot122 TaxID=3342257 RepID=UPI003ECFD0E2
MRRLALLSAIPLFLLAADAVAQSHSYPATSSSISSVQVTAPARTARVYQEHLDAVRGAYALSNGWRMKVGTTANGISAQIDRQPVIRLVAVSPDRFVSRDGNVTMDFNRGENGDDMLMSYVPSDRLAEVIVVGATLAQR